MSAHQHSHSHHHPTHTHAPGERHPHAQVTPSLLRFSVPQRLAIALALAAILWAAVLWAIGWKP
jgi:hypothetical protein